MQTTTTTSTVITPTARLWDGKRRNAIIATILLLVLSVLGFCVSIAAYTYTTNIKAGAFWAQITMVLAGFFLLLGLCLKQSGRGWIVCGLVVTSLGLILTVIGVIVDAVQAGHVASTDFEKCRYMGAPNAVDCKSQGFAGLWYADRCVLEHGPDTCYCCEIHAEQYCDIWGYSTALDDCKYKNDAGITECQFSNSAVDPFTYSCQLKHNDRACYCCSLYVQEHCDLWGKVSLSTKPYKYEGVPSCEAVESRFQQLMWVAMVLHIFVFIIGIVASALAGNYRSAVGAIGIAPVTTHHSTTMSYNQSLYPSQGPVIFYTQQQAVGYYPQMAQSMRPPEYSMVVPGGHTTHLTHGGNGSAANNNQQQPPNAGAGAAQTAQATSSQPAPTQPSQYQLYGNEKPPPYAP